MRAAPLLAPFQAPAWTPALWPPRSTLRSPGPLNCGFSSDSRPRAVQSRRARIGLDFPQRRFSVSRTKSAFS